MYLSSEIKREQDQQNQANKIVEIHHRNADIWI